VFTLILILNLLRKPIGSPWLDAHPLLKKEWYCLCGPRSKFIMIMFSSQKKQKKGFSKAYDDVFEHYFLYIPREICLLIQGNVAHSGSFCFGQNGLKQETNHCLHFYCCPDRKSKNDVDKGKNHNLLDESMRMSLLIWMILSLTKMSDVYMTEN